MAILAATRECGGSDSAGASRLPHRQATVLRRVIVVHAEGSVAANSSSADWTRCVLGVLLGEGEHGAETARAAAVRAQVASNGHVAKPVDNVVIAVASMLAEGRG